MSADNRRYVVPRSPAPRRTSSEPVYALEAPQRFATWEDAARAATAATATGAVTVAGAIGMGSNRSVRQHAGISDDTMNTMIECLIRLINDEFVTGLWTSKPLDKQSIVGSLERLITVVLTSEFSIKLSDTHLHVFKDEHELTIPAQPLLLTPQAFATMESIKRMSKLCFRSVRAEVAGFNQHYSDFIGDDRMNREFPRHIFLLRLVARGLCSSAARAELEHLVLSLRCALRRVAVKIPDTLQHFVWKLYSDLGDNERVLSVARSRAKSRPLLAKTSSQGLLHLPPSHTGAVVVRQFDTGRSPRNSASGHAATTRRRSSGAAAAAARRRGGLFADRAASAGGLADCAAPTRPRTRGGGLF